MGVSRDRGLRQAVATALFVNAFLVFVLQPHITKRLLPVLGGSAEVWMVCTLFFQLALLAGYAAAYGARRLPLAVSLSLHAGLVGVAWLLWPFATGDGPPAGASPPVWTLQLLARCSRVALTLASLPPVCFANRLPALKKTNRGRICLPFLFTM